MRIEQRAAEAGVAIVWRPFLLGPIFREQGWNDSPFNLYPAKGRYMWRDLDRVCGELGLAFRRPSVFPRNGLRAARIACRHAEAAWLPGFVRAVYHANFAEDRDPADPAVLTDLLGRLGLPAEEILARGSEDAAKRTLREQTERAVERGIFGAPSFWVDGELHWGNDRMDAALRAAAAH